MEPSLKLPLAEGVSGIWSALHRGLDVSLSEDEVHCLRMLAFAVDDDLVSSLLLKKIKLASLVAPADLPSDAVRMNSFLEFTFDREPRRFVQIVHPSPFRPSYGVPVTSLLGAGLIGLRGGQMILWPDDKGSLCDLHVVQVENRPRHRPLAGALTCFNR